PDITDESSLDPDASSTAASESAADPDASESDGTDDGSPSPEASAPDSAADADARADSPDAPADSSNPAARASRAAATFLLAQRSHADHSAVFPVPPPGDLALEGVGKGPHAFYAVVRGDDCSVLAYGCTEVAERPSSVTIDLEAQEGSPVGACSGA